MNDKRKKAEKLIYEYFDKLDTTGTNTQYYKDLFKNMSDKEFDNFCRKRLPFKTHISAFKIEPTMDDCNNALKVLGLNLLEPINMPATYKNKKGEPVQSKEALILYRPMKKMKQFIVKKNSMSTNISERDATTGLLINFDKNGIKSDKEFEALMALGLNDTIKELARPRGDAMTDKMEMYNNISLTGEFSLSELPNELDDSIAKNTINAYMIASQLFTNMISDDLMLPYTKRNKQQRVERQV